MNSNRKTYDLGPCASVLTFADRLPITDRQNESVTKTVGLLKVGLKV